MSEAEPESPGDSGTDLRHDQPRSPGASEEEQDSSKMPTIGIRSDLLPTHPIPKEGLDMSHLHGLPALEALRRQAGNTNAFLSGASPVTPLPAVSRTTSLSSVSTQIVSQHTCSVPV